jgi:DNA-binding GntR family transcriptional regulator
MFGQLVCIVNPKDASMLSESIVYPEPRYRQIAGELISSIREGKFAMGTRMPGELDLMRTYKVSRHTVREALRMLQDMQLIERRRGVGTLVVASESREAYIQSVKHPSELLSYPNDSRLRILSTKSIKLSKSKASEFKCPVNSEWTEISGLRTFISNGLPICALRLLVRPEYSGVADQLGNSKVPVFETIVNKYGECVQKVTVDFFSNIVDEMLADLLGIEVGTPVLKIRRRYFGNNGRVFEVSITEHVESNFNFSFEFNRGWKARKR